MDENKETNNLEGKVIIGNFGSGSENQTKKPANTNQTNPIYRKLFNLTHTELNKGKTDYKSFSKFKPEDLR